MEYIVKLAGRALRLNDNILTAVDADYSNTNDTNGKREEREKLVKLIEKLKEIISRNSKVLKELLK